MITPNVLMDNIYTKTLPSRTLSQYSTFLAEHIDHPYAYRLVYSAFMSFFTRNIVAYDYHNEPVCFVGSTCMTYSDILRQAAADFGITIAKITRYSMPGLVEYHASDKD